MPINVNMSLHKGHGLGKHIIAGTNKIDIKDLVASYDTEDSLVVILSSLWEKLNDDSCLRVWLDGTLALGEGEDIVLIVEELESCWLVTLVADVQETVGSRCQLNLTEVDRLAGEGDVNAVCTTLTR